MVAAHLEDLDAARKLGFRTLYIERDQEEKWSTDQARAAKDWVDIWIGATQRGFMGAAEKLAEQRT